jgi:hypothetical protein
VTRGQCARGHERLDVLGQRLVTPPAARQAPEGNEDLGGGCVLGGAAPSGPHGRDRHPCPDATRRGVRGKAGGHNPCMIETY